MDARALAGLGHACLSLVVLRVNAEASHLDFLFRARCTELTSDWASLTAPWCLSPHAQEESNALSNTSFDEFSWQHDFLDFFVTSFFCCGGTGSSLDRASFSTHRLAFS